MFGKRDLSVRQSQASSGYLAVNQTFRTGPIGIAELGAMLARIGNAVEIQEVRQDG